MKKYLLLTVVVLASPVIAQEIDPQPSRSVFKISPQHFTQRQLKVGLERFNPTYSKSFSLYLNALLDRHEASDYKAGYNGFGIELQYRKYIVPLSVRTSKKGNTYYRGIYFSGYLQGGHYSGTQSGVYSSYDPATGIWTSDQQYDYKDDIGNWGGGFTFGFQQTLWSKIYFEAYLGGGLQFSGHSISGTLPDNNHYYYYYYDSSSITSLDYEGILPKIGIQIGIGL